MGAGLDRLAGERALKQFATMIAYPKLKALKLTNQQVIDITSNSVTIEEIRRKLNAGEAVRPFLSVIEPTTPAKDLKTSRQQWLDREFTRLEKVKKVTGIALSTEQMQMVEKWEPEIWRPDYHIMLGGLTRQPSIELAAADGVKLRGGRTGANCAGNDTPTVASIQQWDYEALLDARRTGAPPFNLRCSDQMAWCRENGDGPYLPVEWMYIHSTYQDEHKCRPGILDQIWVWLRTEEVCDAGYWVSVGSGPDFGAGFSWDGDQDAYREGGVGSRKCILTLDLAV